MPFKRNLLIKPFVVKSLFLSSRLLWLDAVLLGMALIMPRFFSLGLIAFSRRLLPGVSRRDMLQNVFRHSQPKPLMEDMVEYWLITVTPHIREKTMVKQFGPRITRAVIASDASGALFTENAISTEHIRRDWLALWLFMLAYGKQGRLFVLSALSDLWFVPLKVHPLCAQIAFDSYDPTAGYSNRRFFKFLNWFQYRLGHRYIIRDPRFTYALRYSGNPAETCYLPDMPQLQVMANADIVKKFTHTDPIRFISAGWVTAHGDGGILRSFQLIRKLWPNAELHLCLTQFMKKDNPEIAPLVAYVESQPDWHVHQSLQGEDYQNLLDRSHVGVNMHDPGVFGEPYKSFPMPLVRRFPSARVLDFASRGCILMTTARQRFGSYLFRQVSPHGVVLNLTPEIEPAALAQAMLQAKDHSAGAKVTDG